MLETRPQRRTDYATRAPMQTARPSASRSSPEAALRCAAGAGLDGDPHGRTTLGRAVWCGATNQPLRRRTPPPRTWRDIPDPNHPQFLPTSHFALSGLIWNSGGLGCSAKHLDGKDGCPIGKSDRAAWPTPAAEIGACDRADAET